MPQAFSSKSLIIVGGGIVGLTIAVTALARGHQVTVIAKDAPEDTASGIAAGMIAPAMEAVNDPDPVMSYQRLQAAQAVWLTMLDVWPETVRTMLTEAQTGARCLYEATEADGAEISRRLLLMAVRFDTEGSGFRISDDWLIEAGGILSALHTDIAEKSGQVIQAMVTDATAQSVTLSGGETLTADHVILAAGYATSTFAERIPSLAHIQPIKGHLLDLPEAAGEGVIRSIQGYWARYAGSAKFGASMQAGQADLTIEPDVVADLITRAEAMASEVTGLDQAVPRVGIRASTPDGWPLIGRDEASGVLVATGMRRNGYVFAPLAARIVLDLVDDLDTDEGDIYRPDRFDKN